MPSESVEDKTSSLLNELRLLKCSSLKSTCLAGRTMQCIEELMAENAKLKRKNHGMVEDFEWGYGNSSVAIDFARALKPSEQVSFENAVYEWKP